MRRTPKRESELKVEGHILECCELRQVKYLNNLVEQDHRFMRRLTRARNELFLV